MVGGALRLLAEGASVLTKLKVASHAAILRVI
jgi:hypothetical protein